MLGWDANSLWKNHIKTSILYLILIFYSCALKDKIVGISPSPKICHFHMNFDIYQVLYVRIHVDALLKYHVLKIFEQWNLIFWVGLYVSTRYFHRKPHSLIMATSCLFILLEFSFAPSKPYYGSLPVNTSISYFMMLSLDVGLFSPWGHCFYVRRSSRGMKFIRNDIFYWFFTYTRLSGVCCHAPLFGI